MIATRTYQHSPAGAGTWTTTPAAFDTTAVTDGLYDLRVIVTDNAGNSTTSATVTNRRVDNTNPTGSVTAPAGASVVSGLTAVSSDSADAGSGVQQVIFQRSPAGAGTWTAIDTDTSAPYSVDWSTGALADGSYDLRAVTGDVAGNTQTSAIVNVLVDNNAPSVTITAPGAFVNAAAPDPFTIAATTPDTDIDNVEFFRCSNASSGCGSGSWISLGTDTTVPYEAQWNVDARREPRASRCRHRSRVEHRRGHERRDHRPGCADRHSGRPRRQPPRHRLADRLRLRSGRQRRGLARFPALARRRRHLDDSGHGHIRSLQRLLRHDRRHGRALRPARDRHRQRRQLDHLGHGRQPPGRQHRSQRQPGRSGRQPAWHRHAQLDRQRRRLRGRLAHLCATRLPAPAPGRRPRLPSTRPASRTGSTTCV